MRNIFCLFHQLEVLSLSDSDHRDSEDIILFPQRVNNFFKVVSSSHKIVLTLRTDLNILLVSKMQFWFIRLIYPNSVMRLAGSTQKVTIGAAENSSIFRELLNANLQL